MDFYDSRGKVVAYIDSDSDDSPTFYLWDGKPAAYLDDDSIYGFNGKQLGWIKGNTIYDHRGNMVAALSGAFASPISIAPFKSFKQSKPLKAFKEFKPFKPFFTSNWSDVPARVSSCRVPRRQGQGVNPGRSEFTGVYHFSPLCNLFPPSICDRVQVH